MLIGRVIIAAVILLVQFAVYASIVRWIRKHYPGHRAPITVTRALFLFFNAVTLGVLLIRPPVSQLPHWVMTFVVSPYYLWYGSTFVLGLILLLLWLVKMPFALLRRAARRIPPVEQRIQKITGLPAVARFDSSRRVFLKHGALGLAATTVGATGYGMYHERSSFDERDETFFLQGLHPGLDGFTIALVTDIHSSVTMGREEMEEVVRRMNALQCDLVVVGGDFVDGRLDEVTPFAEAFSGVRARHGVFGVTGNHDYYTQDTATVLREVSACGVQLLRNEHVMVHRDGGEFCLIGVDDPGRQVNSSPPIPGTMDRAPSNVPRILLCHRPYPFQTAASHGVDLMLSGHTHGGQIVLGKFGDLTLTPAAFVSPYLWGRYVRGNAQLYVSRGIGTVGIPVRINCHPEITRITLRSAPPA
jgi:predicted MPP superfamily phosphohydrolase